MMKKLFPIVAMLLLGGTALNAQTYWSTTQPNCGSFASRQLNNGGYVCEHYGVLPWYSAGAGWTSAIRTQAPSTDAIAVFYSFWDKNDNASALDSSYLGGSSFLNQSVVSFALYANEPSEVDILGLPSEAPAYKTTDASGYVVVAVQCPDATTCSQASAQLLYSALPSQPWSLSVPVVWLNQETNAYSAVGIDDGVTNTLAIVIYNDEVAQQTVQLHIYNAIGNEISQSPVSIQVQGTTGIGLRTLVPGLPAGIYKIKSTGPSYSEFQVLQFSGPSATSLVINSEGTLAPVTTGNSQSRPSFPVKALSRVETGQVQRHAE
jgi:hypothetical protein